MATKESLISEPATVQSTSPHVSPVTGPKAGSTTAAIPQKAAGSNQRRGSVTLYIPKERKHAAMRRRRQCCCCKAAPGFFELLNPTDFDRLVDLKRRMHIPYDPENTEHVRMLVRLWGAAYPDTIASITPVSRHWRRFGFQNDNPATDFRGSGVYSLHAMLFFAESQPDLFRDIVVTGRTYPFAAACINVVHIIKFHLGLAYPEEVSPGFVRHDPTPRIVKRFVHLFIAYEQVVEKIFCACMKLVDIFWRGVLLSPVPKKNSRRNSVFRRRSLETAIQAVAPARADHSVEKSDIPDAVAALYGEVPSNDDFLQAKLPPLYPSSPSELVAILDFPHIITAIRERLDRALSGLDPETCLWSEFEKVLMRGAEGVRFRRTAM